MAGCEIKSISPCLVAAIMTGFEDLLVQAARLIRMPAIQAFAARVRLLMERRRVIAGTSSFPASDF